MLCYPKFKLHFSAASISFSVDLSVISPTFLSRVSAAIVMICSHSKVEFRVSPLTAFTVTCVGSGLLF